MLRRAVRRARTRPLRAAGAARGHLRGRTRRSSKHSRRRLRDSTARRPSTTSPPRSPSVMSESPRPATGIGGVGRAPRRSPAATARFEPASAPLDSSRFTVAGSSGGLLRPFSPVFEATRLAEDGLRAPASGNVPEQTIRARRPRCARSALGPPHCEPPAFVAEKRPERERRGGRGDRASRESVVRRPVDPMVGERAAVVARVGEGPVELERRGSAVARTPPPRRALAWGGRWWGNGPFPDSFGASRPQLRPRPELLERPSRRSGERAVATEVVRGDELSLLEVRLLALTELAAAGRWVLR